MQIQSRHRQTGTTQSSQKLLSLLMNSYAQGARNSELFINNYWLVPHFMALLLTYHHRFPSPAPFFESQVAPSKSGFSWRMENGIVPLSPTGKRASLTRIEEMGLWEQHTEPGTACVVHKLFSSRIYPTKLPKGQSK